MQKIIAGFISLAFSLSTFGVLAASPAAAVQTKAGALKDAQAAYGAALKTARADYLTAAKTARDAYDAALKTAKEDFTAAKKTAAENYKAASEKAKADNSKDERKAALDAYRAAVKDANVSYGAARKDAYAAFKLAMKSAQVSYATARKSALDAYNAAKKAIQLQFAKPKAEAGGIAAAALAASLAPSGAAKNPATVFSSGTRTLYAVLTLANATNRTQLSYIRYYNGKYVDSRVSHPAKNGERYFHFQWTVKAGKTMKSGAYSLALYVNGKKSRTIDYTVQ